MRSIEARPRRAQTVALSAVAALIVSLIALVAMVAPVSADPPGNNGTVKIDGEPFENFPNNEPHVDCIFEVDFYGYDAGDLDASVTFEHWPPTGNGTGDVLFHQEGIDIGHDDNGGGGSEAGWDASVLVDLTQELAGMEPHAQGFHVKLTVHAEGSQGSDVKHKVFWVECEGGVAASTPTPTPTPTQTPGGGAPTPTPTPTPTLGQAGGVLGGNPTPRGAVLAGTLPNTAADVTTEVSIPVVVLAILSVLSLGGLLWARLAQVRIRR